MTAPVFRCDQCRFFAEKRRTHNPELRRQVCRRYPPSNPVGKFSEVQPDDWCGEWLPISREVDVLAPMPRQMSKRIP